MAAFFIDDLVPVQRTFLGAQTLNSSSPPNPTTFSTFSFGTQAPDRYLVAMLSWNGGSSSQVISVTIGGVAATILGQDVLTPGQSAAVVAALVPTGVTGDVVITHATSILFPSVALYSVNSIASASVVFHRNAASSNSISGIVVPDNSTVIAVTGGSNGTGAPSASWTGLTEDTDTHFGPGVGLNLQSSASLDFPIGTTLTVTVAYPQTQTSGDNLAVAVFAP